MEKISFTVYIDRKAIIFCMDIPACEYDHPEQY